MDSTSEGFSSDSSPHPDPDNDQRVYLVPLRWWRDGRDSASTDLDGNRGMLYTASSGSSYGGPMKIINNIFSSDLVFNLRKVEDSFQSTDDGEPIVSGRDYALVPGEMWLEALKWYSSSKAASKDGKTFSVTEEDMIDVYPLQLRVTVAPETNTLGVKISKKDNSVELFRRACKIFSFESDMLRIWDFSGQTTLYFLNEKSKFPKDNRRQSDQEILLELQVYGFSDSIKCRDGKKDEMGSQQHKLSSSSFGTSKMNGGVGDSNSNSVLTNSSVYNGSSAESGSLGLTGLQNLGNTCFMNSSLQCLVHTPKLVDYFLGDYGREINHDNPLGMDGEIALAFGDLLRKLWAPGATTVAPRVFKSKLARFAPQFSGFNQHDSQELLAFLLDGLHEDLNRVKCKPYSEVKDGEGRQDEEIADEYWQNHLARNDSIIVDVCQGQYKSTLVCPDCRKVSVTFDPFMYLSLPLPSTTMRTMTLTVVSTDGKSRLSPYTVTVPNKGKCEDLLQALSVACSLRLDETLLVAEIYNNRIIRYLEEPADSLSLIRDNDRLVAYRLTKDTESAPLVVFMHDHTEEKYIHGKLTLNGKSFGIPLVARLSNNINGSDICSLYMKLLNPFLICAKGALDNNVKSESTAINEVAENGCINLPSSEYVDSTADVELEFHLTDKKGTVKDSKIVLNEPVALTGVPALLNVLVSWPEEHIKKYDICHFSSLPEIFKSGFFAKRAQESVSLYNCLEAFLTKEPLGPEDMWYCPSCKKHCQASKKLDLWRLPEILVIHLKRFSYSRFSKNKLETCVDFPINDLDLSSYISYSNGQSSYRYMLYAISNHYGSMGGGHYTAFVHHGGDRWYDFDDSHVHPINLDKIKTSAAYVLFYRRVVEA